MAAYAGRWIESVMHATSTTLASVTDAAVRGEEIVPWHTRPAPSTLLLSLALLGTAIVGAVPVNATTNAHGQPFAWWVTTVWQIISFTAWVLAAPAVLRFWQAQRNRDAQGLTITEVAANAAAAGPIAGVHALTLPLLTRALFVPLGREGVGSAVAWALAAYLPLDALTYCLIVGLGHASDVDRRARAAAARESAVRGELATARFSSLRAQLHPHFLFNALNAATVLARRGDPNASSRVLTQLAELLRYVLRGADEDANTHGSAPNGDAEMVTLGDEITFAGSYLAIERERFPDRLTMSIEIPADLGAALVPHLLLQPLVENAVLHGVGARLGTSTIVIRAGRVGKALHVTVENIGPAANADVRAATPTRGIGLANTRARLAAIYGEDAELIFTEHPDGSATTHVAVPLRP